jgi:hypothetical protein
LRRKPGNDARQKSAGRFLVGRHSQAVAALEFDGTPVYASGPSAAA